jgi:hypothetical protein
MTCSKMQSGLAVTRTENQKRISKTQHNTKSATNFKHRCALGSHIHVSFEFNQQLARLCVTFFSSSMQSDLAVTRTENHKRISKTQHNTKSATNFKHKCAPHFRIHVRFSFNQQLARLCVTFFSSKMQSGFSVPRTENQKRVSKTQTSKKSATNFKHRSAPHCRRIHVSFEFNQQLARFRFTMTGSIMQRGEVVPRTKNHRQISKTQRNTKPATNFKH